MGRNSSKLSDVETKEIIQKTEGKITEKDILAAHEMWKEANGTNQKGTDLHLSKEQFISFLQKNKKIEPSMASKTFKIIDTDNSGTISFEEFVMSLLLKDSPTPEQFAGLCMVLYDADDDGYITKEEMTRIGRTKLKLEGQVVEDDLRALSKSIDEIFEEIDENGDGKITRQEITTAIHKRPDVRQWLDLCK
eukprot:TRINITY_DN513_c0_g1_i1.p1 TRINITY_DN513_c0_g1~~TRINITY_DN513_c0_g1_i1.p1  ORF type:complete len:192 (-),score=30.23 TRINITY_DN513_c0_g1_i1:56-631(-)